MIFEKSYFLLTRSAQLHNSNFSVGRVNTSLYHYTINLNSYSLSSYIIVILPDQQKAMSDIPSFHKTANCNGFDNDIHEQNSDSSSSSNIMRNDYDPITPSFKHDHDANIVSDTCSNDDSSVDASSTCSNSRAVKSKKRVTWSGLDDLDYVPTRTSPRKRARRRLPRPKNFQKRKACSNSNKAKSQLKTKPKESKTRRKGENVTKVEYLTGTMYIFRGSNPRVEFVRHGK